MKKFLVWVELEQGSLNLTQAQKWKSNQTNITICLDIS